MTNVRIKVGSNTSIMSWDGANASAPISVDGQSTPFRTADARHRTPDAVRLICGYLFGPIYDTDEDALADGRQPGIDEIVIWDHVEYETEYDTEAPVPRPT